MEPPLRIIQEADIVKLEGERLYALSRFSGLSVVDVSDPDQLRVIGHHPMYGEPFEMYVQGGRVIVLIQGWEDPDCWKGGFCSKNSLARVEILDASNPQAVAEQGGVVLPGEVADSRLVGSVLYVASHEKPGCKLCNGQHRTSLSSVATAPGGQVKILDQRSFLSEKTAGPKSLIFQGGRFFLAGGEELRSRVQVVDASDPSGKLALGASVDVEGRVESRWQMDVHAGVLRVISQPAFTDEPPAVETFQVESSQALKPLAKLPFSLPPGERLRTVRFDGDRAFAITVRETDPLFTFDLSDPVEPKQRGELVIPGWVYHIEPRGDRLLALGFDNLNDVGPLNVSLFDVAQLDKPVLLDRVHFAKIGTFVEDRDRIHKAFHIAEEEGLLMVPFSGSFLGANGCTFESGIQLIDYAGDGLKKRGVVPEHGQARRALLKGQRLLALAEDKLRTFDISDRDQPVETSQATLAKKVARTAVVNGRVVQLSGDWWDGTPRLDAVSLKAPEWLDAKVSVAEVAGKIPAYLQCEDSSFPAGIQFLPREDALVAYWPRPEGTHVVIFTFVDGAPKVAGDAVLDFQAQGKIPGLSELIAGPAAAAVNAGRWLVFREDIKQGATTQRLHFIDLLDPTSPKLGPEIVLPAGPLVSPLFFAGSSLYTSHQFEPDKTPDEATFFLDEIDLSSPEPPKAKAPAELPGLLVQPDPGAGSALVVGFRQETATIGPWEQCSSLAKEGNYGPWGIKPHWLYNEVCTWVVREMRQVSFKSTNLVVQDTLSIEDTQHIPTGIGSGASGLLVLQNASLQSGLPPRTLRVRTVDGKLSVEELALPDLGPSKAYKIALSRADRMILLHPTSANVLLVSRRISGPSLAFDSFLLRGKPEQLFLGDSYLLASLGARGVQHIPLP
jgi:hypothetical protein